MKNILFIIAIFSLFSCKAHRNNVHNSEPLEPNFDSYQQKHSASSAYRDSADDRASEEKFAEARLEPKSGSKAQGTVSFYRTNKGIWVKAEVYNVPEGLHGIHIHEKGDCTDEDASSAGQHYNPANLTHGDINPSKYHKGDLGNIRVGQNGSGILNIFIPKEKFGSTNRDWIDIQGKSVILHEKEDDLITQPSGNSGGRIACGVIEKSFNNE